MTTNDTLRELLRDELAYGGQPISCQMGVVARCVCENCRTLRIDAALAEPVSDGRVDPSILDRVTLNDAEAANHKLSCAVYWNNAVTACKHVLREALNGGAVAGQATDKLALAYGYLWHVNNEPGTPSPLYSPGKAACAARQLLRELLTNEQRGKGIHESGVALGFRDALAEPADGYLPTQRSPLCDLPLGELKELVAYSEGSHSPRIRNSSRKVAAWLTLLSATQQEVKPIKISEQLAEEIYNGWRAQDGWTPWVPGGNSDKQDEARREARALLATQQEVKP